MPDINALIANQQIGNTGAAAAANRTLDLQQTWNNAGTTFQGLFFKVTDTASAAGSLLMDLQVGAVSQINFSKAGAIGTSVTDANMFSLATVKVTNCLRVNAEIMAVGTSSTASFLVNGSSNRMVSHSTFVYAWSSQAAGGASYSVLNTGTDTGLARAAAAVPEINNGTKGTYTGTALRLGTQTIAQLPTAATAGSGARATVSDALAPAFGATVAAGGAVVTPVYSDGTNWKVG